MVSALFFCRRGAERRYFEWKKSKNAVQHLNCRHENIYSLLLTLFF